MIDLMGFELRSISSIEMIVGLYENNPQDLQQSHKTHTNHTRVSVVDTLGYPKGE